MLPLKYRKSWLVTGWGLIALAIYGSLTSNPSMVPDGVSDKFLHTGTYATLSFWFAGIYPRSRYAHIAVGLFCLGLAAEFAQGWMRAGRMQDFNDVIANTLGIAIGLLVAFLLGGWAQRIERWLSPA
jgi:VanZ family protein